MNRLAFILGLISVTQCLAADEPNAPTSAFRAPVLLLDVEHQGSAAPFVADFDGDGIKDLLVGEDYRSQLRIYRNVGSNNAPKFQGFSLFRDGNTGLENTAFAPQVVDFDQDGNEDILTAAWPGQIAWFPGSESGFAAAERLQDADGDPIYLQWIHTAFAVDWDGDGDLDVVAGGNTDSRRNGVFLVENVSRGNRMVFAAPKPIADADGPITMGNSFAAPVAADWDGDGKFDLLIGRSDGSVIWYANRGNKGMPSFHKPEVLLEAPAAGGMRGGTARICVTDWNGDGELDLLVGDHGERFDKELSLSEAEQQKLALRRQQERFEDWTNAFRTYRKLRAKGGEPSKTQEQLLQSLRASMLNHKQEIDRHHRRAEFFQPGRQFHGRVWLFLKKQ